MPVTQVDSDVIRTQRALTAWATEEASGSGMPTTCSSDRFQERFTQGLCSVCVLLHAMFLSSTRRAHPRGHGSSSALSALTCSVADSSEKHIHPGEDVWP